MAVNLKLNGLLLLFMASSFYFKCYIGLLSMQWTLNSRDIHHFRFLHERWAKVLEAEHDIMWNSVILQLNRPHVFPLLAHLPISSLLSCPHFTQCISHIPGAAKPVRWGMTQHIGWWGRYQFENRKMSVNLKLNGPVSLHILLIFLFPMMLYSHHSWNVPRIVASFTRHCIWEMAQNIGRWAWYHIGNSKMSVMLKLNGPLLFKLLPIFLSAHLQHNDIE